MTDVRLHQFSRNKLAIVKVLAYSRKSFLWISFRYASQYPEEGLNITHFLGHYHKEIQSPQEMPKSYTLYMLFGIILIDGVIDTEKCFIRKFGMRYVVDIHVRVDANLSVTEGHTIGHIVQSTLQKTFPQIEHVFTHVEPK